MSHSAELDEFNNRAGTNYNGTNGNMKLGTNARGEIMTGMRTIER